MVTIFEHDLDCPVLPWHYKVDLLVISDLREAYTKKQRCTSVSYDANRLFINYQPSSASCQITHCDHIVVV